MDVDDEVPKTRRFVLIDHAVSAAGHPYPGLQVGILSHLDCAFAVHSPYWGNGESFLELFMPEGMPVAAIKVAADYIACRLIFDHKDEEWAPGEEPYDSTVVTMIISESTRTHKRFALFIKAIQKRLKDLGRAQLIIEVQPETSCTEVADDT